MTTKAAKKKVSKKKTVVKKAVEQPTQLIPIEDINAVTVFSDSKVLQDLLEKIYAEATALVPDITTEDGRKAIKANAYNVARSKTAIEKAGKEFVAEQKAAIKKIDNRRKHAREYLDELRDLVRRPVTEWEAEQERIAQEQADADKLVADEEEAYVLHDLWLREEKVRVQEARVAELEERERQRVADEKARELADKAREDERERARLEHADELRKAEERAEKAEREATEKAEQERKDAIEQERQRVAREQEQARLVQEEEDRLERERSENLEHQRTINNAIVAAFMEHDIIQEIAQDVVVLVVTGKIPNMRVDY